MKQINKWTKTINATANGISTPINGSHSLRSEKDDPLHRRQIFCYEQFTMHTNHGIELTSLVMGISVIIPSVIISSMKYLSPDLWLRAN